MPIPNDRIKYNCDDRGRSGSSRDSIAPISDRQVDPETYGNTYLPMAKNLVTALENNSTVRHRCQGIYNLVNDVKLSRNYLIYSEMLS